MATDLVSILGPETTIKVSSTLDKSVGKKYLVDGSPETCWTSQQGLPQYIQLSFPQLVIPKRLSLTFQGGFVGTRCSIETHTPASVDTDIGTSKKEWQALTSIYPGDVNRKQSFDLTGSGRGVKGLKLVFEESSDFFGRITVYDLKLEGVLLEKSQ